MRNFESYNAVRQNTFDEGILGPVGADVRFGGDWDAGTNPLDNPPGLYPRDDLSAVNLMVSRLDNVSHNLPYMRVRSATNSAEARGKVAFNCGGKNQGPFTTASGSVD